MAFCFSVEDYTNDTRFHFNHGLRFGVCMVNFKFIARVLVLVIVSNTAFAGYQSMRPPPGYSRNPDTGGTMQPGWGPVYKSPPGEFYDMTRKQWMTSAQLNTGGRELAVPVAMPLATGVTVGLAVASAFSSNPAILLGTVAWGLYQAYLSSQKITPKTDGSFEKVNDTISETYTWLGSDNLQHPSIREAYENNDGKYLRTCPSGNGDIGEYFISATGNEVSFGWRYCGGGHDFGYAGKRSYVRTTKTETGSSVVPYTPQQVANQMQTSPMSQELIKALPMPLPVESPIFNPGTDNEPRVLRMPQGSPVAQPLPSPNPDNLPRTWKTPVVDVIPAPTPSDPWRVETVPKEITKLSPSPITDPLNPNAPTTTVGQPVEDPDSKTTPKEQTLCEQYPDILACAKPKLDTPETPTLETKPKDITYAPQTGWGGGGGACPAPRHLNGAKVDFEFTMFCNFMSGIKPIVLAFASLAAGMIIIGARGGAAE